MFRVVEPRAVASARNDMAFETSKFYLEIKIDPGAGNCKNSKTRWTLFHRPNYDSVPIVNFIDLNKNGCEKYHVFKWAKPACKQHEKHSDRTLQIEQEVKFKYGDQAKTENPQ